MAQPHEAYYRVLRPVEVWETPSRDSHILIPGKALKVKGDIVKSVEKVEINHVSYLHLAVIHGWILERDTEDEPLVELIAGGTEVCETGRFYYKVVTPINVRTAPDVIAPIIQTTEQRPLQILAGEIVECSQRLTFPESTITYVKLAYSDGWLFENLLCGTVVLERSTTGPARESGEFYYLVRIPVGGRVAPNIMANRSGKGYKLNTILVGNQRFTPPGSTITYVKLKDDEGWVFETTMDGQMVLEKLNVPKERQVKRCFYKTLKDLDIYAKPDSSSDIIKQRKDGIVLECSERVVLHESSKSYLKLRHDDGWVCETDDAGTSIVAKIDKEAITEEKQKFYKVLISVAVRSAPDMDCPRIPGVAPKAVGAVIGSSVRYTPPGGLTFVKLMHEHGWVFEKTPSGQQVLEVLASDPDRKHGKFYYKALDSITVRNSPETDSAVIKHIEKDTVFGVDLKFTLPNDTSLTFLRLMNEKAWITEKTVEGVTLVNDVSENIYNLYASPPSWLAIGHPARKWFRVPTEYGPTAMAEEAMLQISIFQVRNLLATSSQGKDDVPLSRTGWIELAAGGFPVTIEEIKHAASNLLMTFQWKQVWWMFDINGTTHSVQVQHGLRGGYRAILFDDEEIEQTRPVSGVLWDNGSTHEFKRLEHTFKVSIALEGAFFSSYLQFYSYSLTIDGVSILQKNLLQS